MQHGVKIGDGVILWSGNHIGHQSQIGAYTFVSSHAVISGYCTVGRNCFIGVNACLADNLKIGDDCYVAMGAVVNRSFEDPGLMITGHPARAAKVSAYRYFRLDT